MPCAIELAGSRLDRACHCWAGNAAATGSSAGPWCRFRMRRAAALTGAKAGSPSAAAHVRELPGRRCEVV